MIEAQGRHFAHPKEAACVTPSVSGNDLVIAVDQDRHVEAKGLDAVGNLPDLFLGMAPGAGGVGLQLIEPAINDVERCTGL